MALEQELRSTLCRLIAGLVVTDDDLDPAEEAFVDRMLVGFGMDPAQRDVIFPIADRKEAVEAIRGLPTDVRKTALDLLIQATVADGKVATEERAYLEAVAAEMGVAKVDLSNEIARRLAERQAAST